jgi:hypothetical protein
MTAQHARPLARPCGFAVTIAQSDARRVGLVYVIDEGGTTTLLLDVDGDHPIRETGNGGYVMTPKTAVVCSRSNTMNVTNHGVRIRHITSEDETTNGTDACSQSDVRVPSALAMLSPFTVKIGAATFGPLGQRVVMGPQTTARVAAQGLSSRLYWEIHTYET